MAGTKSHKRTKHPKPKAAKKRLKARAAARRPLHPAKIARETFEAALQPAEEKPAIEEKAGVAERSGLPARHEGKKEDSKIELRHYKREGAEKRGNTIPNAATALLAAGALSAIAAALFLALFGTGPLLAAGLASPLFIALSIVLYNRLEEGKKA